MTHLAVECPTLQAAAERCLTEFAITTSARQEFLELTIPPQDGRLVTATGLDDAIRRLHAKRLAEAGQYGQKPPAIVALCVELAWPDPIKGSRLIVRA